MNEEATTRVGPHGNSRRQLRGWRQFGSRCYFFALCMISVTGPYSAKVV